MKDKVLEVLHTGEYVSGEQLAEKLGITRNSVWKAVNRLREQGYVIESRTNRGYILVDAPDILCEADIRGYLGACAEEFSFVLCETVDSTNRLASELAANGAKAGTVVVADAQSAGRGRLGRSFYSPAGSGIYMSVILRPQLELARLPLITACVGVAVAKAVDAVCGVHTGIKWVNDLYLGNKKICGILSQTNIDMENRKANAVVVGIGVNVRKNSFPEELKDIATCLEEQTGKRICRAELIAEILKNCRNAERQINERSFLPEYRQRSILLGKEITVHTATGSYPAVAVDIDENAALVVKTEDGIRIVDSGEASAKWDSHFRRFDLS